MTGTLMRAGDQLRASTQLVEAPEGTLLSSHTVQAPLGDLFQMQDDIARQVVEGLALPLAGERPSTSPDVPNNPRAYELYLRANGLARTYTEMTAARALYEQCVELDPAFAPAWAHLGRCYRVIGKLIEPTPDSDRRAEEAFTRALALNPRLSIAHKFYANLEADTGRARDGMVRLLTEAARRGNDAALFAGLVHACRYCGLFEQSLAAHDEAQRLDPTIPTSLVETLLLNGNFDRISALDPSEHMQGAEVGSRVMGLGFAGRLDEARAVLAVMNTTANSTFKAWGTHIGAWFDGNIERMIANLQAFEALKVLDDPEAAFQVGSLLCDLGEHARGLVYLQRAVTAGYFPAATLETGRQFNAIRSEPAFLTILATANAGRQHAWEAFREAGGERLFATGTASGSGSQAGR